MANTTLTVNTQDGINFNLARSGNLIKLSVENAIAIPAAGVHEIDTYSKVWMLITEGDESRPVLSKKTAKNFYLVFQNICRLSWVVDIRLKNPYNLYVAKEGNKLLIADKEPIELIVTTNNGSSQDLVGDIGKLMIVPIYPYED